jgi:hypothetical protein
LQILILDRLEGGTESQHRIEQFWHCGAKVRQTAPRRFQIGEKALITFEDSVNPQLSEGGDYGWVSPVLGLKLPAPIICVEHQTQFPATLKTLIDLSSLSS